MFQKLSVSKKLALTILTAALFLSSVAVFLLFNLNHTQKQLSFLVNGPFKAESSVYLSRVSMLQLARDIRDFYIQETGSAETQEIHVYDEKIVNDKTELYFQLAQLKKDSMLPSETVNRYVEQIDSWITIGDTIVSSIQQGDSVKAAGLILQECPKALDQASQTALLLQQNAASIVHTVAEKNLTSMRISFIVACGAFIVAMVLTGILFLRVRKGILQPLKEIEGYALRLSNGNLQRQISYESKDEFGQLANHLREAGSVLSAYIEDIHRSMRMLSEGKFHIEQDLKYRGDFMEIQESISRFIETMSTLLKEVRKFTDQVSVGIAEIAAGSQNLAQGSTEQTASIQEIQNHLSVSVAKVNANAANAFGANTAAESACADLVESMKKMDVMRQAMDDIERAAEQIKKIMTSIDEIALQTKLLALNAAVEAARAGVSGKGFGVVAGEVRNLAIKSSQASQQAATFIEQTVTAVHKGVVIARETGTSLVAAVSGVEDATKMLKEISEASARQAQLLEDVSHGMEQVSIVVQNNSATAQQEAAASMELSELANALRNLTNRFEL